MALIYLSANVDDANEAFREGENAGISVNGDVIDTPGADEIGDVLMTLQ
jgi:hypothetical protein